MYIAGGMDSMEMEFLVVKNRLIEGYLYPLVAGRREEEHIHNIASSPAAHY